MGADGSGDSEGDWLSEWELRLDIELEDIPCPDKRWEVIKSRVWELPPHRRNTAYALIRIGRKSMAAPEPRRPGSSLTIKKDGLSLEGVESQHAADVARSIGRVDTDVGSAMGQIRGEQFKAIAGELKPVPAAKKSMAEVVKEERAKVPYAIVVGIVVAVVGGLGSVYVIKWLGPAPDASAVKASVPPDAAPAPPATSAVVAAPVAPSAQTLPAARPTGQKRP
ncbi:hypothetical protein [Sorangium sp. So ce1024]|uniref:hypothetical protein n=1 Tax=Sorangium sp. So ce1024 TaxID=3133327 RepID=UPI003F0832FC